MRRVPLDRLFRFGDRRLVVTEPIEQHRQRVRRPVVARIGPLPDLERLPRLHLIAGDAVVVLVGDEQPLALADVLAVLVGQPRQLFAAAGLAESAVDARQRRVGQREVRIERDGALEERDRLDLAAGGAPLRCLRCRPSAPRATASSLPRSARCAAPARSRDSPSASRTSAVIVPIARRTSSLRSTSTCCRAIVAPVVQSVAASATTVARPTAETLPSSIACRPSRWHSSCATSCVSARVRFASHQLQRAAHALVRHDVEVRRLRTGRR